MDTGLKKQNIMGFIFARGGSKGLPGKNIKPFHGKPLLAWTIECAQKTGIFSRLILSTDDPAIAAVGREYGAETPFLRPSKLATDSAPEWLAWRHAVGYVEETAGPFDLFVCLPAVSPLRSPKDILACVTTYVDNADTTDIVITCTPTGHHPSFNMVFLDAQNRADLAMPIPGKVARRQDVQPVYNIATVCYVCAPGFIKTRNTIFEGRVRAVIIPEERAVDIDTPFDFALAEFLWTRRTKAGTV